MSYRSIVAYRYDGSFEGLMCCVYESVYGRELPIAIYSKDAEQGMLYPSKLIETNPVRAKRVIDSIAGKISKDAHYTVTKGFLTCMPEKELYILKFLLKGYKIGPSVVHMLTDDVVGPLTKAVKFLEQEGHLLNGFVRFTDYGDVLVSTITPKNFVLPVIATHFCDRFRNEAFMIYDKTHKAALLYREGHSEIVPLEEIQLPSVREEEQFYRRLWRQFYNSIGIKGRRNHKCRMNMMPKRYWPNMTEFQDDDMQPRLPQPMGR